MLSYDETVKEGLLEEEVYTPVKPEEYNLTEEEELAAMAKFQEDELDEINTIGVTEEKNEGSADDAGDDEDSEDYDDDTDEYFSLFTERGWHAVSSLLCNKTSIMDTYNSNHTLQDLGCDPSYSSLDEGLELPDDLILYLELNRNEDKVEVARQKILQTQFSDNDTSNMQYLLDMELEVLPAAIEWIRRPTPDWKGTNVSGLTLMYNLMRRVPDLFDSSTLKKNCGAKRKLGH